MPGLASTYTVDVLDRPGQTLPESTRRSLQQEFRTLAAACLDPLPDYQCISSAPDALDDKLIVVVRVRQTKRMVAFTSAIYLRMSLTRDAAKSTVLHTGLTCVSPDSRRQSLISLLFYHLCAYLRTRPEFVGGLWITSASATLSALGFISQYATDVYPSLGQAAPSETHLRIGRAIITHHHHDLHFSANAQLNEATFVVRGHAACFDKDPGNSQNSHRDSEINEFYRELLARDQDSSILQVGIFEWEKMFGMFQQVERMERRFGVEVSTTRHRPSWRAP